MIDILIGATLGFILGIIAGLVPGIHSNLLATAVVTIYAHTTFGLSALSVAVLIYVIALTNTFVSFIPSTYLGVPDSGTALSLLPAHQYLMEGKGHEAVIITLIGALASLIVTIIALPLFFIVMKATYSFIKVHIPIILILIAVTLMIKEKNKFFALYTFIAAGILGITTLNLQIIKEPLLPLLTGLFGMPSLISSMMTKERPQQQKISFPPLNTKTCSKTTLNAVITGSFFSFLPSLGPSQAAVFSSLITKDNSRETYLMIIGALNTVSMIISVATFYAINKARNGAVVAMVNILKEIDMPAMLMFIAITLVLCFPITITMIYISKKFSLLISKVNYQLISIIIMVIIVVISIVLSGPWSLLVLITATSIGFIPVFKNISRNHLMGCLMLSTILWYVL